MSPGMSACEANIETGRTVTIRAIILFSILSCSVTVVAQGNTDVIVMKNGDRFTREIKALSGGALSVKLHYVDGTIEVQWPEYLEPVQMAEAEPQPKMTPFAVRDSKSKSN
jgi:hypothetical protein